MSVFKRLFKRATATEDNILNIGLAMAMEFGNNWLQPINDRLSKKYGFLSASELKEYNDICQNTMHEGHKYIYNRLEKLNDLNGAISDNDLRRDFNDYIKNNFNWISNDNLQNLYSQSCYYVGTDGLDKVILKQ